VRARVGKLSTIGLVHQAISETERLEHLDRATRDSVGLPHRERAIPAVDDGGPDIWEGSHLGSQDQTGRTAPYDQYVDLFGYASGPLRGGRMRISDEWVSAPVTVKIKLHRSTPLRASWHSVQRAV
jgi:hypothetical protein